MVHNGLTRASQHIAMTFDYIIIGAGSAGCVLAERLSASGRHSVCVVEAGGSDKRFFVQMPLGYGKTFYDSSVNWMYNAEADPGLLGQKDHWPRGKVLGGSSSINAMVYVRGAQEDYEEWEALGNPGWGWAHVLKAYRALEDNAAGEDEFRGRGGPVHISQNLDGFHPLYKAYLAACESAGLSFNPDFNGAAQEGAGAYQFTIKGGRRLSAARACLAPAMKRQNVKVLTHALATRINLEGRKATGVQIIRGGRTETITASRETIIAGGAINSPQLLQLSGIGPAALLRRHGIAVVNDLSQVGQNLQDHQGLNYTYRMKVPTLNDELRPWHGKLKAGLQYLIARRGPLAMSINQGGGFFRTSPDQPLPNMQLYMQAFSTLIPRAGERPILSPDPFSGMSLGLSNCRPSSRGFIEIASADPTRHPRIVANAYSTEKDVREMLLAVKFLRHLAAQPALAPLIAEELRPGPSCQSDEDMIADFRQRSGTVYHASCTCRMGPDEKTSVVDSKLRVHGVSNLRVCDASVFPKLIAGNTNAPAMMMGWRGAEIILSEA
jgi:choline dehydrogenase